MYSSMQNAIKLCWKWSAIKHGQIIRIHPVLFFAQFQFHALEEFCSRQWIRNRNADIVRRALTYHLQCLLNIIPCFTWVTELQKESHFDPIFAQQLCSPI